MEKKMTSFSSLPICCMPTGQSFFSFLIFNSLRGFIVLVFLPNNSYLNSHCLRSLILFVICILFLITFLSICFSPGTRNVTSLYNLYFKKIHWRLRWDKFLIIRSKSDQWGPGDLGDLIVQGKWMDLLWYDGSIYL